MARIFVVAVALSVAGCLAGLAGADLETLAKAEGGAAAVERSCNAIQLKKCDELGQSFKEYAMDNQDAAKEHLREVLSANVGMNVASLTTAVETAARMSGEYSEDLRAFGKLVAATVPGQLAPAVVNAVASSPVVNQVSTIASTIAGCGKDTDCKGTRICFRGACVYPREVRSDAGLVPQSPPVSLTHRCLDMLTCQLQCEMLADGACNRLGTIREHRNDRAAARKLYESSCEHGDRSGCYNLARHLMADESTWAQLRALQLHEETCASGMGEACYLAGRMHEAGLATLQSRTTARNRYARACELGILTACERQQP